MTTNATLAGPDQEGTKPLPDLSAWFVVVSAIAVWIVVAIGLLVVIGWIFSIPTLRTLQPGAGPMKFNTAIALILLGLALWLAQPQRDNPGNRRTAGWLAGGAAAIGLLTLAEQLFGWNLGIDQLLIRDELTAVGTTAPGRMSPNSALNLLLIGASFLILEWRTQGERWPFQFLILAACAVALLGLIGYLYGVSELFSLGAFSAMSLPGALAFLALGVGVLSARPKRGLMAVLTSRAAGGALARGLLPLAIGLPLLLGWLSLSGERAGLYDAELGLALMAIGNAAIFGAVIFGYAASLDRSEARRSAAEAALRAANQEIVEGASTLSASVSEISVAAAQLASSSLETATAVNETTTTVEEVKQAAQVSSQKAAYVSETAQKAAQVAQTGRGAVEAAVQGTGRIRQQMETIAESIVRLSEQSQAIGEIIASVSDLAEQSNLLAVNAAIEAAKAGEQGKGFAVVAQEVKSLAEQSKQATGQVRAILNDIQRATSAAVLATEQGSKVVDAGAQKSQESGEAIRQLSESVTESAQAAVQIAASSQQQLAGMDQVALAMEGIKQASAQNVASTQQVEAAAQRLNELGQQLIRVVEQHRG